MKKLIILLTFSFSLIFLCGCNIAGQLINSKPENTTKPVQTDKLTETKESDIKQSAPVYRIQDFYPFKENAKYEYEGRGNEYAAYTVWTDYITENRMQIRKNNGGTELVSVLENKDGELKIIFSREETYFRENFTSKPSNKNEILLKEPLAKGTSWTLPDGRKRYISNTDVDITTPAGGFKALEVTTEGKDYKDLDYYALNTGLIKSVYIAKGMEVSSSLKKFHDNSPLVQSVKFYYPNVNDYKTYFVTKNLTFKTNEITKMSFEKIFKEAPNSTVGKVLSPNAKIKSLYLNNNVVYVDFTKEFVSEMNVGSGPEANILQAITNTLGDYYNADKVYITVEDSPYGSGHIIMKKGEAFTVDFKNALPLK
jgi:spore germination protein GerM